MIKMCINLRYQAVIKAVALVVNKLKVQNLSCPGHCPGKARCI